MPNQSGGEVEQIHRRYRRSMMWSPWPAVLLAFLLSTSSLMGQFVPTTTLTRQTSNNTSASSAFAALPNGDAAPGNVSKISLKKQLPAGFNGKVLAHWMPWWKCTTRPCDGVHDQRDIVRVHYSTQDPNQIDKTIEDMISRGYDGVMVSEANSGGVDTASTLAMAQEMPKFPGFYFAVCENHLTKYHSSAEQFGRMMNDIAFANEHYFGLQNYLRIDGRPVVYVFDNASVDWSRAGAQAPGHPLFILDGPGHASNGTGAFYWFGGIPQNSALTSASALRNLASFNAHAASDSHDVLSGSFFKGFNDVDAAWGKRRIIEQACGLTFVRSLASVRSNLPLLQVVTWNDYEEGTEVETGVDNCGSVSVSLTGSLVKPVPSFTGVGSEETVDHYEVFLSVDGENLMDAGLIAVGGAPLDIGNLGLADGAYKVYVQMVGKSQILNRMSQPVELLVSQGSVHPASSSGLQSNAASTTSASGPAPVSAPSLAVLSPASGAEVSNPVTLTIATNEPFTVARIQVWDEGKKIVDQIDSASVNRADLLLSKGEHTLIINVKDASMATRDSLKWSFHVE